MAHEISSVNVNGRQIVEAMYANEPAWHGLGTIFDKDGRSAPDSETAMELAHLNWPVELREVRTDNGIEIPGFRATVRSDINQPLGIVSDRYSVFQNAEAFKFLDTLLMDGIMRYESAMALRGGQKIALLARMPQIDTVAEGDDQLRYVLCSTSHDGSGAIELLPTSVRVVCANTLRLALAKGGHQRVSVRHTGDLTTKLADAREYLARFNSAFEKQTKVAQVLATRQVSNEDGRAYREELFPTPDEDASERSQTLHRNRVEAVRRAYAKAYTPASIKGTWWHLLNSVTYVTDHETRSRGKNDVARAENRFENVTSGVGADFKDKAFRLAAEMAGVSLAA